MVDLFNLMPQDELSDIQESLRSFIEKGAKEQLPLKKILVLGDIGLDRYVYGDVERVSPEAPVPVVLITNREEKLGLSANVAQNLSALSKSCDLVSMIGSDPYAKSFRALASECEGLNTFFLVSNERPTTVKTRIISKQHHLLRLDDEDNRELNDAEWSEVQILLDNLNWSSYSAVVLQDYGKGFLTETLCQYVIKRAKNNNIITLVDPSLSAPLTKYRGVDIFKPNQKEVVTYKKTPDQSYKELVSEIKNQGAFKIVVNTMGALGVSLFSDELEVRVPTFAKKVFDVTGAGDTVIAALALALSQGLGLKEAAVFSNLCAGYVVGKIGAVTVKFEDLLLDLKQKSVSSHSK